MRKLPYEFASYRPYQTIMHEVFTATMILQRKPLLVVTSQRVYQEVNLKVTRQLPPTGSEANTTIFFLYIYWI